ncbi:hypothetical protein N0V95_005692 [Ascochyta clinopodiicola]|nr:hypothetical protein N0V95_005692 [Ascochyta clinopodiicola]
MSSNTTVLITGANRGPKEPSFSSQEGTDSASLKTLPKASGSRLIMIEIEIASTKSIQRGISSLTTDHNIDSLDIVIANAGIANMSPELSKAGISDIQPFIDVNAYGQLELFQNVAPLLRKSRSKTKGKFMYMSSAAGSLTAMNNIVPLSAYGASKALGNFLFKWLSLEQQDVIVWAQHPG